MVQFALFTIGLAISLAVSSVDSWVFLGGFSKPPENIGNGEGSYIDGDNGSIDAGDNNGGIGIDGGSQGINRLIEGNNNLYDFIQSFQTYDPYQSLNPLIQPRIDSPSTRTTITYKLGKRVSGDRLVASSSSSQQWSVAQNVTQILSYPRTGVGAIITYIEIIVEQSLNLGSAKAPIGGIGERQITITIEALRTFHFRENAQIYGY